jgi:hypothetical protein
MTTNIPTSYSAILSAAQQVLEDSSQEFKDYVPTALFLAEEALHRDIDTDGLAYTTVMPAVVSSPFLNKPNDYRYTKDVSFKTSTGKQILELKTPSYLDVYWPKETSVGVPKYYAHVNQTKIKVAPAPVSAYSVSIHYKRRIPSLSASQPTNYFTSVTPGALFYKTLGYLAEFNRNYPLKQSFDQEYINQVGAVNNEGRQQRRDSNAAPMNPIPELNTLNGEN